MISIPYIKNNIGIMPHPLSNRYCGQLCFAPMLDWEVLIMCYRFGIFPWHNDGEYGAFYFPEERYIIRPNKIKIAKSIRPYLNQNRFHITVDTCFKDVMLYCKKGGIRKDKNTWITSPFLYVYNELHNQGYAHSIEVWNDDRLVGGLYGVAVGKVFTGESMFSLESNASRIALIYLAKILLSKGFEIIDCQVYNNYLASFGGETISDIAFYNIMKSNLWNEDKVGKWSFK
jgi:leucyl/phenylalanyl-tRNA--protein transferase